MDSERKLQELNNMKRVEAVLQHPLFLRNLEDLKELEKDRIWCRHGMDHLVDVARLAYIFNLERGYGLSKDLVYATGLLHDIGRSRQYRDGMPHAMGGLSPAGAVMMACGFSDDEVEMALKAIGEHSDEYANSRGSSPLSEILYDADKQSRACYSCPVEKECKWDEDMKNHTVLW